MAKANYMTLSRTPGDITLTLHEVKLILRVFEGALKNNENITTWSAEVDLYNELTEAYKKQLDDLAADLEYHQRYSVPNQTAEEIVRERKEAEEAKGEAA
jgi:hypothetical protein